MARKFTDKYVDNLKPKAERYEVWDATGLGLRVTSKGKKSWVTLYKLHGKRNRRLTHGRYPQMGLKEARQAHLDAVAEADKGNDPAAAKVAERVADRRAETVEELVDLYIRDYARPNKKTWADDERMLKKDVVAVLGSMKAKDVTKKEVKQVLRRIKRRGASGGRHTATTNDGKTATNRTFSTMRKMFNWAFEEGIIEISPCLGLKMPFKETRRDRVLGEDEIRKFWSEVDSARVTVYTRLILKLLLVTAQRVGEVASMRWSDLDLQEARWTIPASVAKNSNEHLVPLSPMALGLVQAAQTISTSDTWVFPSPRGDSHYTVMAIGQAVRKNREAMAVAHFTPHDLRRTAASHIAELRIPPHVISKILNHTDRSVTAIYNRYLYFDEKKEALEVWSQRLTEITGP